MKATDNQIKIIDRLIFIFMIVFVLSLTNSIFVNQLGYFGALFFILLRWFLTRENQFRKTGLEFAFIWFLTADLIAALFSGNNPQAYLYFSKRALLIPLVYTSIIAAVDLKRTKIYFKLYIGASLITILIYLFFAYKFYIYSLYSLEQSGPSIFQYPITAGEITSFTVLFLFAFLVNEKVTLRNRILLAMGFLLSLLALIATYKRTGWTGVGAGIIFILIMRKQWKTIIVICLIVVALFAVSKNESRFEAYNFGNHTFKKIFILNTNGRAKNVLIENDKVYVSDFNKGLMVFKDTTLIKNIKLPLPIVSLNKWTDDYYVGYSIETRFFLLKKTGDNFSFKKEFITSGLTLSFAISHNYLYVLDRDSGITVFKNPLNLLDTVRYKSFKGYSHINASSNHLALFKPLNTVTIITLRNGLPTKQVLHYQDKSKIYNIYLTNNKLFISDKEGLKLFSTGENKLILLDQNNSISRLFTWKYSNGKLFAVNSDGYLYELKYPVENKINIRFVGKLGSEPTGIQSNDGQLFVTFVKRSRLLSIFDLYNQSNRTRIELWTAGFKMFRDHPIFGVGDIDLGNLYRKYKHNYDKEIQGHMHNNFIQELVTLGLFGFLAFCYMIFRMLFIDLKIYRETRGKPFISSYTLGVLGVVCAFIISGLTEFNFGDQEIITLIWFTFGFNIALYYFHKKQLNNESE